VYRGNAFYRLVIITTAKLQQAGELQTVQADLLGLCRSC
jgi:hypothetical protein